MVMRAQLACAILLFGLFFVIVCSKPQTNPEHGFEVVGRGEQKLVVRVERSTGAGERRKSHKKKKHKRKNDNVSNKKKRKSHGKKNKNKTKKQKQTGKNKHNKQKNKKHKQKNEKNKNKTKKQKQTGKKENQNKNDNEKQNSDTSEKKQSNEAGEDTEYAPGYRTEYLKAAMAAKRAWFVNETKRCEVEGECSTRKESRRRMADLEEYDPTKNGKYRKNNNFEKWATNLKKIWETVDTDKTCQCGLANTDPPNRNRIVNGKEAKPNAYPWQIAMMDNSGFQYCGGSIISDEWILSASHCVEYNGKVDNPKDVFIRVGDHDLETDSDNEYAKTFAVREIVSHPKYDEQSTNNDIALLRLDKKIDFSEFKDTVRPVCLPKFPMKYYGSEVKVTGWGLLSDGGKASQKLMEVDLTLLWMVPCRKDFKYTPTDITNKMMCTFAENKDACQGDSGGPLVLYDEESGRYEQVGVVSWGIGCAEKKYPGVFTKLSHFLQWIMQTIKSSTFCSG